MNILADVTLPLLNTYFPSPFQLTLYDSAHALPPPPSTPCILLCRSTLTVNEALLDRYSFSCVATATSGLNHIDTAALARRDIPLFDAKGANATAVADYVIATLAYLRCHTSFKGTRAGVIGMGHVGTQVAARLEQLGFTLFCYDPPREQTETTFRSCAWHDLLQCDLLCIHANLHNTPPYPTLSLLNEAFFKRIQHPMVIINAARGELVDEGALLNAPPHLRYCTDVYLNEPSPNPALIERATLCTPHIAGQTMEAKYQALLQLSQALHHHYHLPPPYVSFTSPQQLLNPSHWETQWLTWYSPLSETICLKTATDKTTAFLALRQAHQSLKACPIRF